jgi:hypothetical protein
MELLIRAVEDKDIGVCFDMTKQMYGDFMAKHGLAMNDKDLMNVVNMFVTKKQVLVLERAGKVVAMTAWTLSPHMANAKIIVYQEVLWCCNSPVKTDAFVMLRAIEKKAAELCADIVVLSNLSEMNEERLRRIYKLKGFEYLETHYAKRRI